MFSSLIKTFFPISKVWNYFIAWRLGNISIYSYWINVKFLQVSNYLQTKIDIPESNQLMSYKLSFFSHFITELLESVWGGKKKEGGRNLSMHMFLEYLQRKLEFHQQATNVLIFWDTCFVLLFRFLLVFWLAKKKIVIFLRMSKIFKWEFGELYAFFNGCDVLIMKIDDGNDENDGKIITHFRNANVFWQYVLSHIEKVSKTFSFSAHLSNNLCKSKRWVVEKEGTEKKHFSSSWIYLLSRKNVIEMHNLFTCIRILLWVQTRQP